MHKENDHSLNKEIPLDTQEFIVDEIHLEKVEDILIIEENIVIDRDWSCENSELMQETDD